jgi:predicted metal-dependent hydrolase
MKPSHSTENEPFFCPQVLVVGEMHWHILRSAKLMYDKSIEEIKDRSGDGSHLVAVRQKYTDFGKEVGRDEINWWVFKKEPEIEEFKSQVIKALEAAQRLKEASALLKPKRYEAYADLLQALKQFAQDHDAEIKALHQFVLWLAARDVLAPAILFTYRVWGSTRMSDRHFKVDTNEQKPTLATIKSIAEIVFGLTNSLGTPVLFKAEYEIGAEIYENMPFDEESGNLEIKIPMSRVARLASDMAFDECAEYFQMFRDSLRNVLLDTDKFIEQRDLLNDEAFWRALILKVTQTPKSEGQLWDCKETLNMWHAEDSNARDQAKVIFCEDVASLANAHGGVLLIGVTDDREIVGIGGGRELENRLKVAREVLSKHIEYPREIVRLREVVVRGKDGSDKICLVAVVGDACEPVAVHDGAGHYTFPVRRETGLTRVSREEILNPKMHIKSDSHDFLRELYHFVHEK